MIAAIRLAVGTLCVLPVRRPRVDRIVARRAMVLAPAVGALLGGLAAGLAWAADAVGLAPAVVAVTAVGAVAVLTRAIHLDGLADTADGLGSAKPAQAALAVMKASDVGPFGVVTLVLTLLLQVTALTQLWASGRGVSSLVAAVVIGRLAVPIGCLAPPARPDGLGALVAGTVAPPGLAVTTALAATGVFLVAGPRGLLALVAGLAGALLLLRLAVRRFGGITGDVLGALVETATTVSLVVLAAGAGPARGCWS